MQPTPVWFRLELTATLDAHEALTVLLMDWGAGGVIEEEKRLIAYYSPEQKQEVEHHLDTFAACIDGTLQWQWLREEGEPWRDAWKAHFTPFQASPRLAVCPSWETCPAYDPSVRVLRLDPGRAFGTGSHETTRLCLKLLDQLLLETPSTTMLDVGCGSGILSLAAAGLGVDKIVALDVDVEAAAATRENAAVNGTTDQISVVCGDLRSIRGCFPLVVANILYQILLGLAPALARCTTPGGRLILSGLLTYEMPSAVHVYGAHGFREIVRTQDGEWGVVVFEKAD